MLQFLAFSQNHSVDERSSVHNCTYARAENTTVLVIAEVNESWLRVDRAIYRVDTAADAEDVVESVLQEFMFCHFGTCDDPEDASRLHQGLVFISRGIKQRDLRVSRHP